MPGTFYYAYKWLVRYSAGRVEVEIVGRICQGFGQKKTIGKVGPKNLFCMESGRAIRSYW